MVDGYAQQIIENVYIKRKSKIHYNFNISTEYTV